MEMDTDGAGTGLPERYDVIFNETLKTETYRVVKEKLSERTTRLLCHVNVLDRDVKLPVSIIQSNQAKDTVTRRLTGESDNCLSTAEKEGGWGGGGDSVMRH